MTFLLLQNRFPLKQKFPLIEHLDGTWGCRVLKLCQHHSTIFIQSSVILGTLVVFLLTRIPAGLKNLGSSMTWPWFVFLEGMSAWLGRCHHLLSERYLKVSCNDCTPQFTGLRGHRPAVDWQGDWPSTSEWESHSCLFYERIRDSNV